MKFSCFGFRTFLVLFSEGQMTKSFFHCLEHPFWECKLSVFTVNCKKSKKRHHCLNFQIFPFQNFKTRRKYSHILGRGSWMVSKIISNNLAKYFPELFSFFLGLKISGLVLICLVIQLKGPQSQKFKIIQYLVFWRAIHGYMDPILEFGKEVWMKLNDESVTRLISQKSPKEK